MGSYVVKPKADWDLDEYADYLAEANLDLALRFFDLAHRTFALLATQPNMGWRSRLKHPGLASLRVFRVHGFEDLLMFVPAAAGGCRNSEGRSRFAESSGVVAARRG